MHARTLGWPTCTHTNVHTHTSHLITRRHERMHRFMHETCVTRTVGSMGCTNSHEHAHKWMHKLISLSTRVLKVELREWGFFFSVSIDQQWLSILLWQTSLSFLQCVCSCVCGGKKTKSFSFFLCLSLASTSGSLFSAQRETNVYSVLAHFYSCAYVPVEAVAGGFVFLGCTLIRSDSRDVFTFVDKRSAPIRIWWWKVRGHCDVTRRHLRIHALRQLRQHFTQMSDWGNEVIFFFFVSKRSKVNHTFLAMTQSRNSGTKKEIVTIFHIWFWTSCWRFRGVSDVFMFSNL